MDKALTSRQLKLKEANILTKLYDYQFYSVVVMLKFFCQVDEAPFFPYLFHSNPIYLHYSMTFITKLQTNSISKENFYYKLGIEPWTSSSLDYHVNHYIIHIQVLRV